MGQECYICGKAPTQGHNVSHANNKTKRRWIPNLQRVRINVGGNAKRVRVCTQCIVSGKAPKAA